MEFFIPGYVTVFLFKYLTSKTQSKFDIVYSVVISYILKAVAMSLHTVILKNVTVILGMKILVLIGMAIVLALILVMVVESKSFSILLEKINHKSPNDDIWKDVIDYDGTTVVITCEDAIYTGILTAHEEKGIDSWFILEDYSIEENGVSIDTSHSKYPTKLAVNLKTVKRIELYYSE